LAHDALGQAHDEGQINLVPILPAVKGKDDSCHHRVLLVVKFPLRRMATAPGGCSKKAAASEPMWLEHYHPLPMRSGRRVQDLLSPEVVPFDGTGRWYEDCWIGVNKEDDPSVSSPVKIKIS
jgi:hypothetical protein